MELAIHGELMENQEGLLIVAASHRALTHVFHFEANSKSVVTSFSKPNETLYRSVKMFIG